MSVKILALDIDGTITNNKKEVTKETKEAIRYAAAKGVHIVIASGRPITGILPIAKELGMDELGGFILSFNGGRIMNYSTKEIIHDIKLPAKSIPLIYDLACKYNVNVMSYDGDDVISEKIDDEYLRIEARINGLGIKKVDDFVKHIDYPVNKCLLLGEGNYLAEVEKRVYEALHENHDVYRSEPFFLEVLPKGIDKAKSLSILLSKLNLSVEELMCCGDGFNDKSMIEYAGIGVAMANASEIVRNVADFVTLSNEENGVAHAIYKFI